MDDLIRELNRRHKIALTKMGYDFIFAICDYLDLLVLNSSIQQLLQEEQQNLHNPNNISKSYKYLHTNVYEPLRNKSETFKEAFSHFQWLTEEDKKTNSLLDLIELHISPAGKAFRQRKKYIKHLDAIHPRILVLLKNKQFIGANEIVDSTPTEFIKLRNSLGVTPDSKWSDITIRFKNFDDIEISHKNKSIDSDAEQLKFIDARSGKPKQSWTMLKTLALSNGVFPLHKLPTQKDRDKWVSTKKTLSDQLQKIFGISEYPFYAFDKDSDSYKVRFKIIPESSELMVGMHHRLPDKD